MSTTTSNNRIALLREKKEQFCSLSPLQALAAVRCGFELETQSVDGKSYEELLVRPRYETDTMAMQQEVERVVRQLLWDENGAATCLRIASGDSSWVSGRAIIAPASALGRKLAELWGVYSAAGHSITHRVSIAMLLDIATAAGYSGLAEQVQHFLRQAVEGGVDSSNFQYQVQDEEGGDSSYEEPEHDSILAQEEDSCQCGDCRSNRGQSPRPERLRLPRLPKGILAKRDSSVSGPEFVVEGKGTTAGRFSTLLRQLLSSHSIVVDERCSFHIHLSIPGIDHSYGTNLQLHLMEYILLNLHRVPKGVVERWRGDAINYFHPRVTADKYAFVRFHEYYRTWEFRCFGNISNHADGIRCLRLAVEAMQYAYRISLRKQKAVFSSQEQWSERYFSRLLSKKATRSAGLLSLLRRDRMEAVSAQTEAA